MTQDKKNLSQNQSLPPTETDDDEGHAGRDQGEAIAFHFADGVQGLRRDDLLSEVELRRLLIVHQDMHKSRVEKQKTTREERKAKKEGRYVSSMEAQFRQGSGGEGSVSPYKKHPISNMAQFSGIDKQVVSVPNLNEAETNAELKEQLENRLENAYRHQPKFHPKPKPR